MNQSKTILIGVPIHNRAWIMPYYLSHIKNIDYPKSLINLYLIINNSKDKSLEILKKFQETNQEYKNIKIEVKNNNDVVKDKRKNRAVDGIYHWLAELRNMLLDECVNSNCDYLLSCDSDILVNSDILNRLLKHNKDIVSSLVFNGYENTHINSAYKFSNALKFDKNMHVERINSPKIRFPDKNPIGTIISVDITGACILLNKNVCKNTRYGFHNWGEDVYWAIDCKNKDYKLYCDISMLQPHVMNMFFLNRFLEIKKMKEDEIF
jgi:cellulose synthase/poly-beta-1,6-N-acetylglucosamine synthase-like glycosyltransferase